MAVFETMLRHERIDFGYRHDQPIQAVFHSHMEYEIFYFHEGSCRYLIGDKIYELEPGDLILMHGMTLHCPNMSKHQPYVRTICHFDPVYVERLMPIPGAPELMEPFRRLQNIRLPLSPDERQLVERLLVDMHHAWDDGAPSALFRFHLRFYELLLFIFDKCSTHALPGLPPPSEKLEHVQRMISFMEEHYMEDIHLTDLEEALHLNKQYMSKLFKEVTGATVFTYLFERRINQSRILMTMHPEMKLTDISYQVGFKHPAHYSRVFKRHMGMTPEQYRRSLDFNIPLTST